jgi:hypothetical protein
MTEGFDDLRFIQGDDGVVFDNQNLEAFAASHGVFSPSADRTGSARTNPGESRRFPGAAWIL